MHRSHTAQVVALIEQLGINLSRRLVGKTFTVELIKHGGPLSVAPRDLFQLFRWRFRSRKFSMPSTLMKFKVVSRMLAQRASRFPRDALSGNGVGSDEPRSESAGLTYPPRIPRRTSTPANRVRCLRKAG